MAAQRVYGGSVTVETNTTASTSVGAGVSAVRVQGARGDDGHTHAAGPSPALRPAVARDSGRAPLPPLPADIRGAKIIPGGHECGCRVAILTDRGWFCRGCGVELQLHSPDTGSEAA